MSLSQKCSISEKSTHTIILRKISRFKFNFLFAWEKMKILVLLSIVSQCKTLTYPSNHFNKKHDQNVQFDKKLYFKVHLNLTLIIKVITTINLVIILSKQIINFSFQTKLGCILIIYPGHAVS